MRFWYEVASYRAQKWMPGYTAELHSPDGMKSVRVAIDDIESDECPQSILISNPVVSDLVQVFQQSHAIKGYLGPPSQWPGAFADAMGILIEQQAVDKAALRRVR